MAFTEVYPSGYACRSGSVAVVPMPAREPWRMTPERWRRAGRQGRIGKAPVGHGEANIGWPVFTGYWPNQETAFQTSQQTALQTFAVAFAASLGHFLHAIRDASGRRGTLVRTRVSNT